MQNYEHIVQGGSDDEEYYDEEDPEGRDWIKEPLRIW